MAKLSKHFEVTIPFTKTIPDNSDGRVKHFCDITITGVGYRYTNEEPENEFDYDIDELHCDDKYVPLNVFEALGIELKELDDVHNAVMAHMHYLFSDEYDKEKQAQDMPEYESVKAMHEMLDSFFGSSKSDAA